MRTLLGAMTLGLLLGCGGEDESLLTATQAAALDQRPPGMEVAKAEPEKWVLVFNVELLRWELVQVPVEERHFYEVHPTATPPATTPPPCPTCR